MAPGKLARLTKEEREAALVDLPAWHYAEDRMALYRRIELGNFVAAFGLMTQIAIMAEAADHHPEWSNVYNRIDIWLTTHDADGVSHRDTALAAQIDRLAGMITS